MERYRQGPTLIHVMGRSEPVKLMTGLDVNLAQTSAP
jgi:hypothetical protein